MCISPDIRDIAVDKVLSFNYTNTYEKLYGENKFIEYDYIHGKANVHNTVNSNNMVLGIDEYLPNDRKDKDIEFIAFKKFYQRIHKQTGCKYKEWVDEIRQEYWEYISKQKEADVRREAYPGDGLQAMLNRLTAEAMKITKCPMHRLYIFGHSLDVTDKDILKDLILNDNVYTTIYYFSQDDLGTKIANLVKVIGQDELIRRTGGSTKNIEFKLQQGMVVREE